MLKLGKILLLSLVVGFTFQAVAADLNNPNQLTDCQGDDISRWDKCWGTAHYDNGDNWVGEWLAGQRGRLGTYTFQKSGNSYSGEFSNGKPNGRVRKRYASGEQFIGIWVNDSPEGQGVEYFKDGKISRQGTWEKAKLVKSHKVDLAKFNFLPIGEMDLYWAVNEKPKTTKMKTFSLDLKEEKKPAESKKRQKLTGNYDATLYSKTGLPKFVGNIRLGMTEAEFRKLYPKKYGEQFGLAPYASVTRYEEGELVILGDPTSDVITTSGQKLAGAFRVQFWNDYLFNIEVRRPSFSFRDLETKYGRPFVYSPASPQKSQCTQGNGVVAYETSSGAVGYRTWLDEEVAVDHAQSNITWSPTFLEQSPPRCGTSSLEGATEYRILSFAVFKKYSKADQRVLKKQREAEENKIKTNKNF